MVDDAKRIVAVVTDSLRSHPVAIAILSLNVIFLAASAWTTHEIASNAKAREASFHELLRNCIEEAQRAPRSRQ